MKRTYEIPKAEYIELKDVITTSAGGEGFLEGITGVGGSDGDQWSPFE